MRVLRGRATSIPADRAVTRDLTAHVAAAREPCLRVWYPHEQVAFGRRDVTSDGYDRARSRAADRGYSPVERRVGGRAVAFTGDTLAFVRVEPAAATDPGIDGRYTRTLETLADTLRERGVAVARGEPPDSFCPGTYSLQIGAGDGNPSPGKIAGLAQRVRRDVALVAGVVIVDDADAVADVLAPVYDALDVPFDPDSVSSVTAATSETVDLDRIRDRTEAAFVGNRDSTVRFVRDT